VSRGRLEQQLAALDSLKSDVPGPGTEGALRKALSARNNYYVSKAAAVVEQMGLKQLIPEIAAAYARFFEEEDPQCWAKNALVKALGELGYQEPEPFLRGLTHVQMEAVWGGRVDTAGTLRGYCAVALVGCRAVPALEVLRHLTPALVDAEKTVRMETARAVASLGRDEGGLLLRLRALQGDVEPEVVGALFSAIIALERGEGIAFVAKFLRSGTDAAGEAALALGESHDPTALEMLKNELQNLSDRSLHRTILTAIALTRLSEATAYLLGLVRAGGPGASEARGALFECGALSEEQRAVLREL
jgi:hypothetical protein